MHDLLPAGLLSEMRRNDSQRDWLEALPGMIRDLRRTWSLRLGPPFQGGSCSWVAPVERRDGARAVLKITWPHREAAGEADALEVWDGAGAVRLLDHDRERYALLIERCEPGTELGEDPGPAEDRLIAGAQVLRGLWCPPSPEARLERVADVAAEWADLIEERMDRHRPDLDPGLVALGAGLLRDLPRTAAREVVVHGDFNPGNVLASGRGGWLAIDPKPMVGDPAYDPWPLVEQIDDPFEHDDPEQVLRNRFALVADVLGEDPRRLQAWAAARDIENALWCVEHGEADGAVEAMESGRLLADLAGV
ncbi:aminoglycoside phosphotransferase family protein [Saccharopolyspora taberi]|uniref:Aminoglycoside phosphotransferase family protein n=1 Tax=Saccharopolyspora taberi TaxID=60895 RepID=A0ABN3V730_9PSEU